MDKRRLSEIFDNIALLLEIKGENQFKSKAYINAARALELFDEDIEQYIDDNKLEGIKGIGKAIAEKIIEYSNTGRLEYYEELKKTVPAGIFEMLKIPGIGPKKVKMLLEKLDVKTIGELEYACIENRLAELEGFGKKTQDNILKGIEYIKKYKGQYLYGDVYEQAVRMKEQLGKSEYVIRFEIAGSLRRKKEIVKDIDIVASSANPSALIDSFVGFPYVNEIIAKGDTKASVRLKCGVNMDLRVVSDIEYPYVLNHFTGSKEHNTAIRSRAKAMGIKVNEYGLFKDDKLLQCSNEEDIYKALGLSYIPPELRENHGEIEAAEMNMLPGLVSKKDIRGTFHMHTIYSDGANTIEEMAMEARRLGMSYIGITDHSRSAFYARGMNLDEIKIQLEEIDSINNRLQDFRIFKGIECDILPDGSLDYDENTLSMFDFVIASVHSNFKMDKNSMTNRLVTALKNKYTTMLGHPTGRLLLARNEYELDMHTVIDTASAYGKIIEINSDPHRLDLDWRYMKYAKEKGIRLSINTDAHCINGLRNLEYGISMARKGWLEVKDIINTLTAEEITDLFREVKADRN